MALEEIEGRGCGDVLWEAVVCCQTEDREGPGSICLCGMFGDGEGGLGGGA